MSQKNENKYDASGFLFALDSTLDVPKLTAKAKATCAKLLKEFPNLVSEESLETLSPMIMEYALSSCEAASEAWNTIQAKSRALSRLTPSDDSNSNLASCLKNLKIDLKGSDNIVDDSSHVALKAKLDDLVKEFKSNANEIYFENAKLEAKKAMERLKIIFFEMCLQLSRGSVRYVIEMNKLETKTDIEILAGQTTSRMITKSFSNCEQCLDIFGYETGSEWNEDLVNLKFNGNLPHERDSDEHHDRDIVRGCANKVRDVVGDTIVSLLIRKEEEHRIAEIQQRFQLERMQEEQQRANDDVKSLLRSREGEENQVQNDLINTLVDQKLEPLKRENDQLSQKVKTLERLLNNEKRSKSSGGGKDQSLNAKKNGHGSKGVKGKQPQKQQKQKQQQTKGTKKVRIQAGANTSASQQGSGKGGGGRGSRRA